MTYENEKVEYVIKKVVKENKVDALDYLSLVILTGKILFLSENKKSEEKT